MDDMLKKQLSEKLRALGAGVKADGSIGYADPDKDKLWQQFQSEIAKRGSNSSSVPSSANETLANYEEQTTAQTKAQARNNDVALTFARGQIPLLKQKNDIEVGAYGGKLNANVGAQRALLGDNYGHEQQLDLNTTDRLKMVLASDQQYYDQISGLAEKQMGQQNTANILNLITNLALGGAALFA